MDNPELQPKQKTRLVIGQETTVKREGSEASYVRRAINLERKSSKAPVSYYRIKDLSNTQSIEIVTRDGGAERIIQLPEGMLEKIAEYMRVYEKEEGSLQDADCAIFAHMVNGVPFTAPPKQSDWNISNLDEEGLPAGATAVLATRNPRDPRNVKIVHWAIYLEDGLYLSKMGDEKLEVTTLAEMKRMFSVGMAMRVTPKKNSNDVV